ncbi:hypothetical protein AAES_113569 [Amazona aestiva]|uniref:Uncharacterized protein n=1 Tax=Amazona aestiva TaxID=12930 RepID=A0A0Q3M800_AMAAE|nr:hypothetical protein AAES_113569 [Amazona aestiva]
MSPLPFRQCSWPADGTSSIEKHCLSNLEIHRHAWKKDYIVMGLSSFRRLAYLKEKFRHFQGEDLRDVTSVPSPCPGQQSKDIAYVIFTTSDCPKQSGKQAGAVNNIAKGDKAVQSPSQKYLKICEEAVHQSISAKYYCYGTGVHNGTCGQLEEIGEEDWSR